MKKKCDLYLRIYIIITGPLLSPDPVSDGYEKDKTQEKEHQGYKRSYNDTGYL